MVRIAKRVAAGTTGKTHQPRWALLIGAFSIIFCSLGIGRFGYPAILPYMQEGMSLTNTQMGILASGNLFGYLLFSALAGILAARYRPRQLIVLCQLVLSASLMLTGFATNFPFALVTQTLVGMASAGCVVATLGLVSSSFSGATRGLATGIAAAGAGLGLIFSSLLVSTVQAGLLQAAWRYSWLVLGVVVFLSTTLSYVLLATAGQDELVTVPEVGGKAARAWVEVYKSPLVWYIAMSSVFFSFAYIGYSTFFVKFLVWEVGLSGNIVSWLWGMVGTSGLFSAVLWGWLSDTWGRKPSLIMAFLTLAVSLFLSTLTRYLPLLGLSAILFGISAWSTLAIIVAIYGDQIRPGLTSAAIGLTNLLFGFGQAMGAGIAGYVAEQTGSFSYAFAIAAGSALLGMLTAIFLKLPARSEDRLATDQG